MLSSFSIGAGEHRNGVSSYENPLKTCKATFSVGVEEEGDVGEDAKWMSWFLQSTLIPGCTAEKIVSIEPLYHHDESKATRGGRQDRRELWLHRC